LGLAAGVDFGVESVESAAERGFDWPRLRHDLGEFGAQQPCVGSGEEQRDAQTVWRELIAVAMGNAFDDAVEAETAKVVSHPADGIAGRVETQQLRQQNAYFPIVEPTGLETEYDQYGKQSLYSLVAKAKRGGPLTFHLQWADYLVERVFANRAVVGDFLNVEKTPVGLKADLPQSGQVPE